MTSVADILNLPCGIQLKNRLVKAAMTEGLADADNRATPRLERLYKAWAEGGSGLLLTGNVQVDRRSLERAGNVAIDGKQSPEALSALRTWAKAGTANGTELWMQISHPGRQAPKVINPHPVAPSAVLLNLNGQFGRPRALDGKEILDVIERFVHAARTARDCGFTGVQIHAAHGYLISEFLSPDINLRTDEWGGSLENRARLLLEIIKAVRAAVGRDYPICVKLNSADYQKGAFTHEDAIQVARWIEEASVDLLEISGGTFESANMTGNEDARLFPNRKEPMQRSTIAREAYFLKYAEDIRARTKLPLLVTGGFRTLTAMNAALDSSAIDAIGIARPYCTQPDLANQLLAGTLDRISSHEDRLRLGPTRWLGPNSPIRIIKLLNTFGQLFWFYEQIVALADEGKPNEALGLLKAIRQQMGREKGQIRALRGRPS